MSNNNDWVLIEQSRVREDFDDFGEMFAFHPKYGVLRVDGFTKLGSEGFTHWKRTGLKTPSPPT